MRLDDFDFDLPPDRIASRPTERRDEARLLVLERTTGAVAHRTIGDLADELRPTDLLIVNDTRVRPARLGGTKPTGGRLELLLVRRESTEAASAEIWEALIDVARPPRVGSVLSLDGGMRAEVLGRAEAGWRVKLVPPVGVAVDAVLEQHGRMPLPPYVRRAREGGDSDAFDELDRERYQTIFADRAGAVAAPTAGLHFSPRLLEALEQVGIRVARITLHVGPGTFLPIRSESIEQHRMHEEWCEVSPETAAAVESTRAAGGRIVAVGTTVVRTLESRATPCGAVEAGADWCSLFIRPGFRFRVVDAMLTNFHLPRSTLLMLVAAFVGREPMLAAYARAIAEGYRFYSYGDAMLIHEGRGAR